MMHYGQIGCSAYGLSGAGVNAAATAVNLQTPPGAGGGHQDAMQQQGDSGEGIEVGGIRGHADINSILNQIMNITDQSLDEAQVKMFLLHATSFLV